MLALLFRWLRRLRRPAGLGLAAMLPALLLGALFGYEVLAASSRAHPLLRAELAVNDHFLRVGGRAAAQRADIVFMGIDDATLTLDGLWPEEIEASPALKLINESKGDLNWSREVYALLLDRLADAGAKLVIFDMVFPNPARGDEAFRAALARHHGRVVVGSKFSSGQRTVALVPPAATLLPAAPDDPRVGYVNYRADLDGAIRLAFFTATPSAYLGSSSRSGEPVYRSLVASALWQLGRVDLIPPDGKPRLFRYTAAPRTDYPPRPLWEIFTDATWKQNYGGGCFLRDKIVVVGASAPILHDVQPTPHGDILGPDLQLQVLTAALARDYLRMTSVWSDFALILAAGALAWGLGLLMPTPLARLGLLLLASGSFLGAVRWLYDHFGLMPLIFTPLLAFNLGGLGGLIGEYAVERVEKARVRGVLDRLVSKDIVRELLSHRERYDQLVRGHRQAVTVLFSDVRGFSTLSESAADPAAFVAQLNEYLSAMVEVVFKHQGTLDKFIGDAVMAVWGSMHTEGADTDARQAVSAALEMRARLEALNVRWAAEGRLQLAVGFGLDHGEVIVGGLGSELTKMEITVMGDAVNTASRLEGLTKEYGLDLLIGERVAARVSEVFRLRTVDLVRVKGKKKPTEVMAVLGPLSETPSEKYEEMLADYEDAILLFRHRGFAAAARRLEDCLRIEPGDGLCLLYLRRCRALLEDAPPADWDGVRLMTTK